MATRRRESTSFDALAAYRATRDAHGLDASSRLLLLVLLTHVDEHGQCWPSLPTLASETSLSLNTLRTHRARLQALGVLLVNPQWIATRRNRARPTSTLYRIDLAQLLRLTR